MADKLPKVKPPKVKLTKKNIPKPKQTSGTFLDYAKKNLPLESKEFFGKLKTKTAGNTGVIAERMSGRVLGDNQNVVNPPAQDSVNYQQTVDTLSARQPAKDSVITTDTRYEPVDTQLGTVPELTPPVNGGVPEPTYGASKGVPLFSDQQQPQSNVIDMKILEDEQKRLQEIEDAKTQEFHRPGFVRPVLIKDELPPEQYEQYKESYSLLDADVSKVKEQNDIIKAIIGRKKTTGKSYASYDFTKNDYLQTAEKFLNEDYTVGDQAKESITETALRNLPFIFGSNPYTMALGVGLNYLIDYTPTYEQINKINGLIATNPEVAKAFGNKLLNINEPDMIETTAMALGNIVASLPSFSRAGNFTQTLAPFLNPTKVKNLHGVTKLIETGKNIGKAVPLTSATFYLQDKMTGGHTDESPMMHSPIITGGAFGLMSAVTSSVLEYIPQKYRPFAAPVSQIIMGGLSFSGGEALGDYIRGDLRSYEQYIPAMINGMGLAGFHAFTNNVKSSAIDKIINSDYAEYERTRKRLDAVNAIMEESVTQMGETKDASAYAGYKQIVDNAKQERVELISTMNTLSGKINGLAQEYEKKIIELPVIKNKKIGVPELRPDATGDINSPLDPVGLGKILVEKLSLPYPEMGKTLTEFKENNKEVTYETFEDVANLAYEPAALYVPEFVKIVKDKVSDKVYGQMSEMMDMKDSKGNPIKVTAKNKTQILTEFLTKNNPRAKEVEQVRNLHDLLFGEIGDIKIVSKIMDSGREVPTDKAMAYYKNRVIQLLYGLTDNPTASSHESNHFLEDNFLTQREINHLNRVTKIPPDKKEAYDKLVEERGKSIQELDHLAEANLITREDYERQIGNVESRFEQSVNNMKEEIRSNDLARFITQEGINPETDIVNGKLSEQAQRTMIKGLMWNKIKRFMRLTTLKSPEEIKQELLLGKYKNRIPIDENREFSKVTLPEEIELLKRDVKQLVDDWRKEKALPQEEVKPQGEVKPQEEFSPEVKQLIKELGVTEEEFMNLVQESVDKATTIYKGRTLPQYETPPAKEEVTETSKKRKRRKKPTETDKSSMRLLMASMMRVDEGRIRAALKHTEEQIQKEEQKKKNLDKTYSVRNLSQKKKQASILRDALLETQGAGKFPSKIDVEDATMQKIIREARKNGQILRVAGFMTEADNSRHEKAIDIITRMAQIEKIRNETAEEIRLDKEGMALSPEDYKTLMNNKRKKAAEMLNKKTKSGELDISKGRITIGETEPIPKAERYNVIPEDISEQRDIQGRGNIPNQQVIDFVEERMLHGNPERTGLTEKALLEMREGTTLRSEQLVTAGEFIAMKARQTMGLLDVPVEFFTKGKDKSEKLNVLNKSLSEMKKMMVNASGAITEAGRTLQLSKKYYEKYIDPLDSFYEKVTPVLEQLANEKRNAQRKLKELKAAKETGVYQGKAISPEDYEMLVREQLKEIEQLSETQNLMLDITNDNTNGEVLLAKHEVMLAEHNRVLTEPQREVIRTKIAMLGQAENNYRKALQETYENINHIGNANTYLKPFADGLTKAQEELFTVLQLTRPTDIWGAMGTAMRLNVIGARTIFTNFTNNFMFAMSRLQDSFTGNLMRRFVSLTADMGGAEWKEDLKLMQSRPTFVQSFNAYAGKWLNTFIDQLKNPSDLPLEIYEKTIGVNKYTHILSPTNKIKQALDKNVAGTEDNLMPQVLKPSGLDRFLNRVLGGKFGEGQLTIIYDRLSKAMESLIEMQPVLMAKALTLGDKPVYAAEYERAIIKKLMRTGLMSFEEAKANSKLAPEHMTKEAQQEALESIYAEPNFFQRLYNNLQAMIARNEKIPDMIKRPLSFAVTGVVMFPKIPTNVARRIIEYAIPVYPLVKGMNKLHMAKDKTGQERIALMEDGINDLAKFTTGMSYIAMGTVLGSANIISGFLPKPDKLKEVGEQPFKLNVTRLRQALANATTNGKFKADSEHWQDGDLLLDLRYLGVLGASLIVSASTSRDLKDDVKQITPLPLELAGMKYDNAQPVEADSMTADFLNSINLYSGNVLKTAYNQASLFGLNALFEAASSGDATVPKLQYVAATVATAPFVSSLAINGADMLYETSPNQKDFSYDTQNVTEIWKRLRHLDPFHEGVHDDILPDKYDATGNPVPSNKGSFISDEWIPDMYIFSKLKKPADKIKLQELYEIYGTQDVIPPSVSSIVTVDGKQRKIKKEDYEEIQKKVGRERMSAVDMLLKTVNKSSSPEDKENYKKNLIKEYGRDRKTEMKNLINKYK